MTVAFPVELLSKKVYNVCRSTSKRHCVGVNNECFSHSARKRVQVTPFLVGRMAGHGKHKKEQTMTELETKRLEDFKRILTYHLASKIRYFFKDNYELYYRAPQIWELWKARKIKYTPKIYELIAKFNSTSLSNQQLSHIFGRDESKKYLRYSKLIAEDKDIKVFKHGTITMGQNKRIPISTKYQLPFEHIKSIFEDKKLLEKVLDAGSDYYSDRQRRLIFTQINKQKNYSYKSAEVEDKDAIEEKMIEELLKDM